MNRISIQRELTNQFSATAIALSKNQDTLFPLIENSFSIEAFGNQIEKKSKVFGPEKRKILFETLLNRYSKYGIVPTDEVQANLDLLQNQTTFTITTGHQLNLFTGPVFFVYKILHVVKLCRELKVKYPNHNFVPVYWMASEDHDFEEIQSTNIFNQNLKWESRENGAVGRFSLDNLNEVKSTFLQFFERFPESEIFELFRKLEGATYGEAFFKFVHALFQDFGLVILEGDDKAFKSEFSEIVKKELFQPFVHEAITTSNHILEQQRIKAQIHPREINLFLLNEDGRNRIIPVEEGFEVAQKSFSNQEMLELLESSPEMFSPNVALRPVYQEFVLPNLCYVGGVGELNYWLQLGNVFRGANVLYPLIQVRNSALWLDEVSKKKWQDLRFSHIDLFLPIHELKQKYIAEQAEDDVDFSAVQFHLSNLKNELSLKTEKIDQGLKSWIGAENQKLDKQIDGIEQRLNKAIKSKFEKGIKTIEQVKERLFPHGELQERFVNFFQFCADGNVSEKLNTVYQCIEPLQNDFLIFNYD